MTINRQNLSRTISAKTKREVRQRDGFGCIVCGSAYYHYDHLGTEFKDADEHNPQKIVLLCGGCHDRKNRGALSTETLQIHAKSPKCRQTNFSWGPLDTGLEHPQIILGTLTATKVRSLLTIDGEDVFSIAPPTSPQSPFTINASLFDKEGRQTLKIVNNEFQASASSWDVEIKGPRVSIRNAPGEFDLVMRVEPPHRVIIERLDMAYKYFFIKSREGHDTIIEGPSGVLKTYEAIFNECDIAILVSESSLSMGVGGGSLFIEKMTLNPSSKERPFEPINRINPYFFLPKPNPNLNNKQKQKQNEQCNCGSGKKYKRCHGASR